MDKKKERRTWEERHEIWNEVAEEYGMTVDELRKAVMPWPAGDIEKGLLDEEDLRKVLKNKGYKPKNKMDRNEDPRDQIVKQNNPKETFEEEMEKLDREINKAYNFQDSREAIFRRNNPTEEEKRMNLEAGWYCDKENGFKTEPMKKWAKNLKEHGLEEISEYAKAVEKKRRIDKNTEEHGPVLAQFIEDGREHEAEQIKENVNRMMKRGMLSEEEEKAIMERFGPHKKEYEAPKCKEINYVSNGDDEQTIPVEMVKENSFTDIVWKLNDLHNRKNHDYGNAAHESYKEFGLISYIIRLNDKMKRLKSLTKPGAEQQVKEESIVDTLMDLAAYSIMAIESLKSDE